ncbi:Leucine-rich repeat-containing protein 45 [Physocladia obscura]|uniref:Leucine-rich repeat-containing protein 45 n=1 Tax=Physocladia obscura TaxID=109957 RepID=A0AAD5T7A9_9FUNG|nr:Leucine-rich repeat-containing protein 45 [Physocladia obscura]
MFCEQVAAECAHLGACETATASVVQALKNAAKEENKVALTALCTVLSKDVIIASLCLSDVFLGDDGAILISGCLKKNTTIVHLDLRGNNIRSDGAIALAQMLKINSTLKSLFLEWNCIGIWETGIKAIADAISVNGALEILDLRNCKLSPQGVNMLSLGVKNNKALRSLDLRWNSAGLVGGRGFLQAFKLNNTLTRLDLVGNEIPEDLLRAIESCIERNATHMKELETSKINANFLASTFQQLSANHQNTIDSLSMKLELTNETKNDATEKLAGVSKDLLQSLESKRVLEENLKILESKNKELGSTIANLQKEILSGKEKTASVEYESSKSMGQIQTKFKDLEVVSKELDLHVSILKKDKAFLVDELEKVKRREKDRMDFTEEKLQRLEQSHRRNLEEIEVEKEREYLEKVRIYEDRLHYIDSQKQKILEDFDRAKADFMAEKHKLLDLMSEAEVKIRSDEAKKRQTLESEISSLRALKDKIQEDLSIQISIHTAHIRDHQSEIQTLTNAKKALTDELSRLESKHAKALNEHSTLIADHESLRKVVRNQEEKIKNLDSKIDNYVTDIEHLRKKLTREHENHEKITSEKEKAIESLREDLKSWIRPIDVLQLRRISKYFDYCISTRHFALLNLKRFTKPQFDRTGSRIVNKTPSEYDGLFFLLPATYRAVYAEVFLKPLTELEWGEDDIYLQSPIPQDIGRLTNLVRLNLNDCGLTGSIPSEISQLVLLQTLSLYENELEGIIPSDIGALRNLTELYLGRNKLSGEIPEAVGSLTSLTILNLGPNNLCGSIPPQLGQLKYLTELYLANNYLSGSIPLEIWYLPNAKDMFLHGNQLTGTIPKDIKNLVNARCLYFEDNMLSGEVPVEIMSLTRLEDLDMRNNSGLTASFEFDLLRI